MSIDGLISKDDFKERVYVITGGAGVLCSEIARVLLACGAKVAILDLHPERAESEFSGQSAPGEAIFLKSDVVKRDSLENAAVEVLRRYGRIDALINGAGGNNPRATTGPEQPFAELPEDVLRFVVDLNLMGTVLPSQVFGRYMIDQQEGVILNVSSMNALRPLTNIPAYSAAKAAVSNFTQWLAVHMAQEYSSRIRVNAIAPGFFMTAQNRFLLTDEKTGDLTERGKQIIDHTPMKRFGEPRDLVSTVLWLLSPQSSFVTGVVIPVDGGFSAYSGV